MSTSKIIQLDPLLAEKIAAGEVVERPLSVVKELLENSIDAQSKRIEVFLEEGGKKSIIVQDDGVGMNPADLRLCVKRHATSKIKKLEDLFEIRSLGFRGEALPSIASVSRFKIQSRSKENAEFPGYELLIEGGVKIYEQEVGIAYGTKIEVSDLFYNTPARLKFLKSSETEVGHIEDLICALALSTPSIQFFLHHKNKLKLKFVSHHLKDRISELWGASLAQSFYPFEFSSSEMSLKGFLAHPNFSASSQKDLFLFVNGRWVKDRVFSHAVVKGFHGFLMKEQSPRGVFFLDLPPSEVDVNVHPAKREVRFVASQKVHQFVSLNLAKFLASGPWSKPSSFIETKEIASAQHALESELQVVDESVPFQFLASALPAQKRIPENLAAGADENYHQSIKESLNSFVNRQENEAPRVSYREQELFSKVGKQAFSDLRVLGQLFKTYILCESPSKLVLIDQHAAHEKIGFEKLKREYLQKRSIASQSLISPVIISLKAAEIELLAPHFEKFENLGLVMSEMSQEKIRVSASPTLLGFTEVESLVHSILSDLKEWGSSVQIEDKLEDLFALMACHRQIRAGDALSLIEMQTLISQLDEGAALYHCPHGRPVMTEISQSEIEKWFKRVL